MATQLKCSTGLHTVRLRDDRYWRRAICPKCKTQIDRTRLWRLVYRLKKTFSKPRPEPIGDDIRYANLRWRIDRLASTAWQSQSALSQSTFLLEPDSLRGLNRRDIVRSYLNHVRQIAPGLPVPIRVPEITNQVSDEAAGTFGATDGWPVISISSDTTGIESVRAVLAHEVCHYVLNAAGLREENTETNEKLTDLCMFVLGLGHVFLSGYKTQGSAEEYRPGHRLGYLTDSEYAFASRYVMEARRENTLNLPSKVEYIRSKILLRAGSEHALNRLVNDARRRFPNKSEIEIHQSVYDQLAR